MNSKVVGERIKREQDFEQFLKVLNRQGKPKYIPFYEHIASNGFISNRLGKDITILEGKEYWHSYADFWLSMGFDCIPMEIPLSFGEILRKQQQSQITHQSEANACIFSMDDFKEFPWPDESHPINLEPFEIVAEYIPENIKIVGGVMMGPYEIATIRLLGVMGLSFALVDNIELVQAIFDKLKILYVNANKQLASMNCIGACREGDDLGFKTSTFLPPDILRKYIFPIYKGMVDAVHSYGKPFILHSCGCLEEVYNDIIDLGVDAKHSFEDQIMPVWEFQQKYGDSITPLGGLDVDKICRSNEKDLREYTRIVIEKCIKDNRYWALGTGNSLTNYMPVDNYLIVLDESIRFNVSIA